MKERTEHRTTFLTVRLIKNAETWPREQHEKRPQNIAEKYLGERLPSLRHSTPAGQRLEKHKQQAASHATYIQTQLSGREKQCNFQTNSVCQSGTPTKSSDERSDRQTDKGEERKDSSTRPTACRFLGLSAAHWTLAPCK